MRNDVQWQIPEFRPDDVVLVATYAYDAARPGPLIGSVEALLAYLTEHRVPVAGKSDQFPNAHLPAMNACLPEPWAVALKRPRMRSYPNLEALWLVMGVAGLIDVSGTGKKRTFVVREEAVDAWRAMSDQGRYAVLFEAWLLRGRPQLLERFVGMLGDTPFQCMKDAVSWARHWGKHDYTSRDIQRRTRALGLASLFGLLELRHGEPDEQGGWTVHDLKTNRYGNALLRISDKLFKANEPMSFAVYEGALELGTLRPLLATVFPEWRSDLPLKQWAFREGTYILDVVLGRARRRLAFPAEFSFDDLADAILESVDFAKDHLYQFSIYRHWQEQLTLHHDWDNDFPKAGEVAVGGVGLEIGDRFDFLFDFGDNWQFELEVVGIEPQKSETWQLVQAKGEAPVQYPSFDEDDYEDDEDW